MAGKAFFIKNGYEVAGVAKPDLELLVKKFNAHTPLPNFRIDPSKDLKKYKKGLTILRADQCPYTVKNVREIIETARKKYDLKTNLINFTSYRDAQKSPCPFGIFCIIYNGKIVAEHPISRKRFENILNKLELSE